MAHETDNSDVERIPFLLADIEEALKLDKPDDLKSKTPNVESALHALERFNSLMNRVH